jgi:hypothetical protein
MRVRALTLLTLAVALAAVPAGAKTRGLRAFASCAQLLDYARTNATKAVGTGWAPSPMAIEGPRPGRVPTQKSGAQAMPVASQDSAAAGAGAGDTFSTTNVQEAGVDEPDVVKTDGSVIYAVANGVLHAVDVKSGTPKLLAALKLDDGYGHELLLHGDRLLVVQSAWLDTSAPSRKVAGSDVAGMPVYAGRAVTRLTEVDVSDPSALRVLRTERDDGEYVSARMTGDTVRIVLAARAPIMYAVAEASAASERKLVGKRLRQVRRAKLAAWRPRMFFRDARRPKHARLASLTRCGDVRHTARFSGLDTVTILTVDMAKGLPSLDADAIMSDAQIVYGSPDRLYVATQRWLAPAVMERPEAPPTTTQIHEFDTSQPDQTSYVASGEVPGYLLNQFALSQHHGILRVASTETPTWWQAGATNGNGSTVTTLDTATLSKVGSVGGLGKGERIYAVRFIDDVGYVVTFRQVDPLFTIDLSNPAEPRVAGELKVAGYSAYLHPIGKDLLLGVGQDAGEDGRTTGTQLSVFDVSDPAHPARLVKHAIGQGSSSTAEFDHHAFLYWPQTKLAVIPLALYDYEGGGDPFVGAIGFHVDRDSIDEVGRISHPHDEYSLWDIQRATVVGDRLFTLSSAGMLSSALSDLAAGPFVAFPDIPTYQYGCGRQATSGGVVSCPAAAR